MKQLPDDLLIAKNRIAIAAPWVVLLELFLDGTTKRFARNTNSVQYLGDTYEAFPFGLEMPSETGSGEIPTLTLRVCNITQLLEQFLETLDGLVGRTVVMHFVDTGLLDKDHSALDRTYKVLSCYDNDEWVVFRLGGRNPLHQRFPQYRYSAIHCNFEFENAECAYTRKTIVDVTLATPVSIEVTGHNWSTGDNIRLASVNGISPTLAGNYDITKVDVNNFTLDGTAGSGYSGAYTSGGTAGYSVCKRRYVDCVERENATRYGAFVGIRTGTVRFA